MEEMNHRLSRIRIQVGIQWNEFEDNLSTIVLAIVSFRGHSDVFFLCVRTDVMSCRVLREKGYLES